MLIHLHKQATTTPKVRAAIQASTEPASALAERFGTTEQTVYKWKHRDTVHDRSHTPHRLQTTLTPAQEAVAVVLRKTLYGKGVRALMQSPTGAQLVGIDTARLHPLMFGIGMGLSGVAGCLLSMTYTISPSMGEPYTVTALIVITLGGFGSMGGALAGGLLLGVIEALGMHFTNPSLKALLSYVVFIGVLLLRPEGLFARKTRKA